MKKNPEDLKKNLTPEQFYVTQECGTEPPFNNPYWDNHEPGLYVDIITGEPLFTSLDKYDSGTGWPSFTKPISNSALTRHIDDSIKSYHGPRIEIKSKSSGGHLGHVFDDGPQDRGGKRYCMNSAAMRFVPVEQLKAQGYENFLPLFEKLKK